MSTLTSQLDAKASRIAERVDDLGHEAAERLHSAAGSIRKGGQQGSKAIKDFAEGTATKLDGAGSYVDEYDLKHTLRESRQLFRRYPVESLVLAAGVGFLTGFAMSRLTHACDKTVAPVACG